MKRIAFLLPLLLIAVLALSACQPAGQPADGVSAYLDALVAADYATAAAQVSQYSLDLFGVTAQDVQDQLQKISDMGYKVVSYEITSTDQRNSQSAIISLKVTQQYSTEAPYTSETVVPVYKEKGSWKVNWRNAIDHINLNVEAQTVNGVTVKPVRIIRFPDLFEFVIQAENTTTAPVYWGVVEDVIATTWVGDTEVNAAMSLAIPGLDVPVSLDAAGKADKIDLYFTGEASEYPTKLIIKGWAAEAVQGAATWSYDFEIKRGK